VELLTFHSSGILLDTRYF